VKTPYASGSVEHVYHVYAIRAKNRDEIFKKLKDSGIGVVIHYPIPLHLQKAYESLGYRQNDFPVSERVAQDVVSLPMYPHIQEKQIKFVVQTLKKIIKG
jgi:dTDP-4-amino-4,6-dideoxygalactose transaminase